MRMWKLVSIHLNFNWSKKSTQLYTNYYAYFPCRVKSLLWCKSIPKKMMPNLNFTIVCCSQPQHIIQCTLTIAGSISYKQKLPGVQTDWICKRLKYFGGNLFTFYSLSLGLDVCSCACVCAYHWSYVLSRTTNRPTNLPRIHKHVCVCFFIFNTFYTTNETECLFFILLFAETVFNNLKTAISNVKIRCVRVRKRWDFIYT